ncbi:alternative tryptophan synthase beta-subunit [Microbacterium sp. NPDC089180]|uniref:Alternative tryptophan synthase beta-subunit n=1 Tax=Microbacterium galbum TaxID=3075994 RepID=A0ABU3T303_9MICO|nr:alternative tryptophan synthase beta-subunit [Microbacterium sp. KSW4-17]MDU0365720.1 alternative tryptophan synthase beta-subunit [Microbacterium sp. KSW4-17]
MTRPRTVTHAYRMPGGWETLPHRPLTAETAHALRDEGYTLVRARRGWGNSKELSLSHYTQQPAGAAPWSDADIRPSGSSAA